MKSTLEVSKLQTAMSIIETQMGQEKLENKLHQQQIKKLQSDMLDMDSEVEKRHETKKIIAEKKNNIQTLEKEIENSSNSANSGF